LSQTQWASEVGIVRDAGGYRGTSSGLRRSKRCPALWPLSRDIYELETSMPGSFADHTRHASIKHGAAAVGEGRTAEALADRYLADG
jgi:hypothetical protein